MPVNEPIPELVRQPSDAADYSVMQCPVCRGQLMVHQPDERLPERLLGTCRSCFTWFLIDSGDGITLRVPGTDTLKGTSTLT